MKIGCIKLPLLYILIKSDETSSAILLYNKAISTDGNKVTVIKINE